MWGKRRSLHACFFLRGRRRKRNGPSLVAGSGQGGEKEALFKELRERLECVVVSLLLRRRNGLFGASGVAYFRTKQCPAWWNKEVIYERGFCALSGGGRTGSILFFCRAPKSGIWRRFLAWPHSTREEIFYFSSTRALFSSFFNQSIISLSPFLCFFMCWIDSLSFRLFRSLSSFPFKRGGKGNDASRGGARV